MAVRPPPRECLARQVQPILNWRRKGNYAGGFSADDFHYLEERDVYICPAGQELHHAADHFTLRRAVYRPKRGTCAGCPLRSDCTTGVGDRQLQRSWAADATDLLRAQMTTRHGQRLLRRRQVVSEKAMADLKSKHGFDRAQFRGRASVQIQALLTAAVINLKQLVKRPPEAQSGWLLPEALLRALSGLDAALLTVFGRATSSPIALT